MLFFTHAWAKDEESRDTHERVKELAFRMRSKHKWDVWLDEERLSASPTGHIEGVVCEALDASTIAVVCVTKKYCEKVQTAAVQSSVRDVCGTEWNYINARRMRKIAVIMEASLAKGGMWPCGVVASHLACTLWIDYSGDSCSEAASALHHRLMSSGLTPSHTPRHPSTMRATAVRRGDAPRLGAKGLLLFRPLQPARVAPILVLSGLSGVEKQGIVTLSKSKLEVSHVEAKRTRIQRLQNLVHGFFGTLTLQYKS